ncbi:MAG: alanine racemase [Methyloligellaceae bacterium]
MSELPDATNHEAIDTEFAGDTAILTIDLDALAANYHLLNKKSSRAICAAVVKADAYGLGVEPVVKRLLKEGCRTFFVANLNEAIKVRAVSSNIVIFNMGGLFPDTAPSYTKHNIFPVLNTVEEITEWTEHSRQLSHDTSGAAIQFNTGMNRMGMQCKALKELISSNKLKAFNLKLIMSHLACADEPDHELNLKQLKEFSTIRKLLPEIPASLCNSAGILLGEDYHFDIVRPGISLYGGCSTVKGPNLMKPVASLNGRIAQIENVPAGQSVGYGAMQTLKRNSRIATIALGYADGFFRFLGSTDDIQKTSIAIGKYKAQLVGRVSMDLITVDITDIPEDLVQRSMLVEIMGTHISVDDLARQAGTIPYEILTNLGNRYRRIYKEAVKSNG